MGAGSDLANGGASGHPEAAPAGDPGAGVPVFGYLGRLQPAKGIDLLLRASRRLADDGVAHRVRVVGDGPALPGLRQLAAALALPTVEFAPVVPHHRVAEVYAGFTVNVLPSRSTPAWVEQFGRTLIEAAACGVPSVGAATGEIPWLIREFDLGLVFPEGDAAGLAAALHALLRRPHRPPAPEVFSYPRLAGELAAHLERAIAVGRRARRRLAGTVG